MIRLLLLAVPLLHAQTGSVEGMVVDTGHRGIPGVRVDLTSSGSKTPVRTTFTDTSGKFRVAGLPPGDYGASFDKPGYGGGINASRSPRTAHIASDGDTVQLSAELIQLASLSGRVLDSDGRPFPNMRVQLRTASTQSHMVLLITDNTGDDGAFRFKGLWPGQYVLQAQPVPRSITGGIVRPGAEPKKEEKKKPFPAPPTVDGERWMWVNTYYPAVMERKLAARIAVHPGWDLRGQDIRLLAAPVFRVRGLVLGEDGRPAPGVTVGMSLADKLEDDSTGVASNPDGVFEFEAVHPGEWNLMALLRRDKEKVELRGFADIAVARHDVENVVLHLAAPTSVSGAVEVAEAAAPMTKSPVGSITLEAVTHFWSATGHPQPNGTFVVKDVFPDRYRIVPYGVELGYYVESIRVGGRDVTGQEMLLGPGALPIQVIAKAGDGRVRGRVEKGEGATAVLLPSDESMLTYQYVRTAKCDKDGRFEWTGLRPGDYYVMAFDAADQNALEDPDFVRPLLAYATPVRVESGRFSSVDLKLMAWPE